MIILFFLVIFASMPYASAAVDEAPVPSIAAIVLPIPQTSGDMALLEGSVLKAGKYVREGDVVYVDVNAFAGMMYDNAVRLNTVLPGVTRNQWVAAWKQKYSLTQEKVYPAWLYNTALKVHPTHFVLLSQDEQRAIFGAAPAVKVTDPSVVADPGATPGVVQKQVETMLSAYTTELDKRTATALAAAKRLESAVKNFSGKEKQLNDAVAAARQSATDAAGSLAGISGQAEVASKAQLAAAESAVRANNAAEVVSLHAESTRENANRAETAARGIQGSMILLAVLALIGVALGFIAARRAAAVKARVEKIEPRLEAVQESVVETNIVFYTLMPTKADLVKMSAGDTVVVEASRGRDDYRLVIEVLKDGYFMTNLRRGTPASFHYGEVSSPVKIKNYNPLDLKMAIVQGRLPPEGEQRAEPDISPTRRAA